MCVRSRHYSLCSSVFLLLYNAGEDTYAFEKKPRLCRLVADEVTDDKLRQYLSDQGGEARVLEILGGQQEGQHCLDEQLSIHRLVF